MIWPKTSRHDGLVVSTRGRRPCRAFGSSQVSCQQNDLRGRGLSLALLYLHSSSSTVADFILDLLLFSLPLSPPLSGNLGRPRQPCGAPKDRDVGAPPGKLQQESYSTSVLLSKSFVFHREKSEGLDDVPLAPPRMRVHGDTRRTPWLGSSSLPWGFSFSPFSPFSLPPLN